MNFIDQKFYKTQCTMELRYKSRAGCPMLSSGQTTQFVDDHKVLVGIGMIALGILLAFVGYYFLDVVIFIVAFAASTLSLAYIGVMSTSESSPDWLLWTIFIGSVL